MAYSTSSVYDRIGFQKPYRAARYASGVVSQWLNFSSSGRSDVNLQAPYSYADLQPYSYAPLPKGPWIRILQILPGRTDDPIQCRLRTVELGSEFGSYDALSYAWGSAEPSHKIRIDDGTVSIRENLFRFLITLRSTKHILDLWADAICIDQDSTAERNHQVQQMRLIYQSSRITRVWLGQANLDNDMASSEQLTALLRNEYWSRLWIIQEVVVSPEVLVHITKSGMPWRNFAAKCSVKSSASLGLAQQLAQTTIPRLDRQRIEKQSRATFVALLRAFYHSECSDLRDRVYGLLGLANDLELVVDYRLSRMQLFEQVIRKYEAQYTEDFVLLLWHALHLFATAEGSYSFLSDPLSLQLQDAGHVKSRQQQLFWSKRSWLELAPISHTTNSIRAGDTLCSLSDPLQSRKGKIKNDRVVLFVLRRRSDNKSEFYVSGIARICRPEQLPLRTQLLEDHLSKGRVSVRKSGQSSSETEFTLSIHPCHFLAILAICGFRTFRSLTVLPDRIILPASWLPEQGKLDSTEVEPYSTQENVPAVEKQDAKQDVLEWLRQSGDHMEQQSQAAAEMTYVQDKATT